MPDSNDIYWRRKLSAYLHDTPDKVLSIVDHEERARRLAGEVPTEERARKDSDWAASAADRLPFPKSSETRTELACFKHPLGGDGTTIALNEGRLPVGAAEQTSQVTRPRLSEDNPRAAFIATWRFWRNWASSRHADFALYPAETRLPDHTIWNHLAVTSAMQGCLGGSLESFWKAKSANEPIPLPPDSPAFLLFTIGPVQDFILASRSTRDLWSGSYLLSHLIGHAMHRVSLDFGPDHILFPNLCDQPIMDLLLRDEIWSQVGTNGENNLFDAFDYFHTDDGKQRLLTPSLPNRFLAVLPANMVEHRHRGAQFESVAAYAGHIAEDLRRYFKEKIAGAVSRTAEKALGTRFNADRFDLQVDRLLEIHWQVLPWPASFEDAEQLARHLPADKSDGSYAPRAGLKTILNLAKHGADSRYLKDGRPRNVAAAWSSLYSMTEWLLDGTKANRAFAPSAGGHSHPTKDNSKDSLNGRDEAVLLVESGDEARDADALSEALAKALGKGHLLKAGEDLGAGSLIKRLWPFAYLCPKYGFENRDLNMPNTRSIAARRPWEDDAGDDDASEDERYFAVLALDGDNMGKWISGSKTPELDKLLSEKCAEAYRQAGANLEHRRPLSPSWHLQFSEALGNFSQHAARRVVEAFDGRLIYAGGDDVLAMLPAETALACADSLQLAFSGSIDLNTVALGRLEGAGSGRRSDRTTPLFDIRTPGFLRLTPDASARHGIGAGLLDDPVNFPAIVPGPNASCSVGIAIAHHNSPLQDVIRAAQAAEKRAKSNPDKAALAVSLFKRSGEIIEWGCRWSDGGIKAHNQMISALQTEVVSRKFPHRIVERVEGYLARQPGRSIGMLPVDAFEMQIEQILELELSDIIDRQKGKQSSGMAAASLKASILEYLATVGKTDGADLVQALIGLCQTVAFIERNLKKPSLT